MTKFNADERREITGFRPWYTLITIPLVIILFVGFTMLVIALPILAQRSNETHKQNGGTFGSTITLLVDPNSIGANDAQRRVFRQTVVVIKDSVGKRGTGFLIKSEVVITASHIGDDEDNDFKVICSGHNVDAARIAIDRNRDVSVLRAKGCKAETLVLNAEQAHVDDHLLICGFNFPNGMATQFVTGTSLIPGASLIVPEKDKTTSDGRRTLMIIGSGTSLIAIAGVLNFGNSGSPVVNEDGSIVGMAIIRDASLHRSFIVSASEIKTVMLEKKL